ncbi:group 1 truncated hemoglobin [Halomonas sp. YLGW01]|uniref:group I truncated hemoglobin n=1 Tax=Halomonas sp. YLGW01 TaxID=2773308 RepID=UPI001F5B847A|nr:group 1 truncated hemoglobin [Halomonas sp. YLGW01]
MIGSSLTPPSSSTRASRRTSFRQAYRSAPSSLALIAGLVMLGGCAHSAPSTSLDAQGSPPGGGLSSAETSASADHETLYATLGGETVIAAVVDDFLYRIAGDQRIVGFFANTNIDHFDEAFATQLCDISDGPCDYTGPSMARAHQQMGLTEAHFNAVVGHLRAALIDQGVATGPRNRLLGRLASLHDAVMLRQP